jgi:hypothetical protein
VGVEVPYCVSIYLSTITKRDFEEQLNLQRIVNSKSAIESSFNCWKTDYISLPPNSNVTDIISNP